MDIAMNRFSGVSQPSVSRSIHALIDVSNRDEILGEYIKFYENIQEMRAARDRFYEKFEFPNTIGCIDGTHIAITAPKTDDPVAPERVYINRKRYGMLIFEFEM